MNQAQLFHDSIFDALGADIAALGGFKKVAQVLWPTMDLTSATAKLRASVNADQPHKLCALEVLRIKELAHQVGSHATVDFEAQHLGCRVEWLDPQNESDELRRDVRDLLTAANQRLDRIERAESRAMARKPK